MTEKYPELTDRIQSTFIDTLLIISLMFAFASILDKMQDPPDWIRITMFLGVWLIYEPFCTAFGCTVGNYIKGIRVKQSGNTTKRINIFQAVVRYAFKCFLGWISFLTINSNPKRRAIHDMAAASVMIKL